MSGPKFTMAPAVYAVDYQFDKSRTHQNGQIWGDGELKILPAIKDENNSKILLIDSGLVKASKGTNKNDLKPVDMDMTMNFMCCFPY